MGECRHRWTEAYICSVCGKDKQARIPMWVLAVKLKRGPRAVLIALWTFADSDTHDPRPIWPHNKTIADRAGQLGISTLSTHISWLLAAGWIRTRDKPMREFELAWKEPFSADRRTPGKLKTVDSLPKNRKASPDSSDPKNREGGSDSSGSKVPKTGGGIPKTRNHTYQLPDHDRLITDQSGTPAPPSEQFELLPPSEETTPDETATPAAIRAWWDEVYVPLRAATLDAYRPGSAKPIRCSDSRLKAVRARLADACPNEPWTEQRDRLTHVVRNAAARVHEHRGKLTSWAWNSLDAIQPVHWSAEKNFTKYYEAPAAYDPSGSVQAPDEFPGWMKPRAANQTPLSDVEDYQR